MFPKWVYLTFVLGFNVVQKLLRLPYEMRFKKQLKDTVKVNQYDVLEKVLLYGLSIGLLFIPLAWTLTQWFMFSERTYSEVLFICGIIVMILSLGLFWKTHHDLADNWSPTLMVMEDHRLITTGIYKKIRHPMYTAELLFCVAQLLIIPNWLVGASSLFFFLILIIVRIPREEALMIAEFGDEYLQYQSVTGGIFPKIK